MTLNVFDYFEELPTRDGDGSPWAARAPRRPRERYDLKLLPRSPQWQQDGDSLLALEQVRQEPWVKEVRRGADGVRVLLADSWVEMTGAALEAGGQPRPPLAHPAPGGGRVRSGRPSAGGGLAVSRGQDPERHRR